MGLGVVMSTPRKPKGKTNKPTKKKKINPLQVEAGESGVGSLMKNFLDDDERLGKVILIEPREWLDYACVGVMEDLNNDTMRAVYDLNLLTHALSLELTYSIHPEDSIKKLHTRMEQLDTYEQAIEWVNHNTLRAIPYMGPNAPMITRNRLYSGWQTAKSWGEVY